MKIKDIEERINGKTLRKLNIKRLIVAGVIIGIILISIILFIIYSVNKPFRDLLDKYILMKNVVEDSTNSIILDEDESNNIYAYDKHICVLSKNTLKNYNSSGKLEGEITIKINTPIIATNGRYITIAEKEKNKIYLVSGNEIIWEKELDGSIDKMTVNKNGYVAVILSGTTYKSIIQIFDNNGNELFKTYLSSTTVIDADISLDNQYLAFVEINTSGTAAYSTIKTVSIQKAKNEEEDSILYTYSEQDGKLITNIKYQESNKLLCMDDDGIYIVGKESKDKIVNFKDEETKISFASIELSSNVYRVTEKSSLLSTQTNVEITNTGNNKTNTYSFEGVTKQCYSYNNCISINTGAEVHFISPNGWLIKKYISNQEVQNVVMNNSFAGIVYRNKIEIVNI